MPVTDNHNLHVLQVMNDRQLRELIAGVLPDKPTYDDLWRLLLSEQLAERTVMALGELIADIDGQYAIAKQQEPDSADWSIRVRRFKTSVLMRHGRAKHALKQHNLTADKQVQVWQTAAHQLAAAIVRHERDLEAEASDSDRALWAHLDTVTRPDGRSVRHWMAEHQPKTGVA